MTADVQRWIAIAVVGVAAAYLSWRGWCARRVVAELHGAPGCGPRCGCGTAGKSTGVTERKER